MLQRNMQGEVPRAICDTTVRPLRSADFFTCLVRTHLASEKIQFAQAVECHVWKLAQCELRVSSRKLRHVRRTCSVPFFFDLHVYSHIQFKSHSWTIFFSPRDGLKKMTTFHVP